MVKDFLYLDYSATTKPDEKVISCFNELVENQFANPNSSHSIGVAAKEVVEKAILNISDFLNVAPDEIIFTSGASEANNLAIKGITLNSQRKQIITTGLEHSSIFGPFGYLQKMGYQIDFVNLTTDGLVDIKHLKSLLSDETLLVSIGAVDSEIGIRQPIEEIGLLLKGDPDLYFHSDITQCLGKVPIDLTHVDLASFSGHKIYCFKGIGGLVKKKNMKLSPLIHGGKSTTVFRSGTPPTELIGALSESFNLFKTTLEKNVAYVERLNQKLRERLATYPNVFMNSTTHSIPHILNLSIMGAPAAHIQKYFETHNVFISTKAACASSEDLSRSILTITKDPLRASSAVRISLSHKTDEQALERFVQLFNDYMEAIKHETN